MSCATSPGLKNVRKTGVTRLGRLLGRFNSLRWRMTFYYGGLLSLLLLSLGMFVYIQLDHFLTQSLKDRLENRAAALLVNPLVTNGGPRERGNLDQNAIQRLTDVVYRNTASDITPQLLNPGGNPVAPPQDLLQSAGTLPVPEAALLQQVQQAEVFYTIRLNDNNQQVLLTPVYSNNPAALNDNRPGGRNRLLGYLMLATPLAEVEEVLNQLRFLLVVGVLVTLALVYALGLPLARLSLKPLKRMARTATGIGQGEWSQRVAQVPGEDEVSQLAQAFNKMLDQIEAAFAAQKQSENQTRQFVADASHELRSPLTVLGGYLDVLLMGAKDNPEQTERILRSMRQEVGRLSRMVVDLLMLTRLDARGPSSLKLAPLDLAAVARQAIGNMDVLAGGRQIILKEEPLDGKAGPLRILGDGDHLYRVLANLLDNALRYTGPQGHIIISLTSEKAAGRPGQPGWAVLRVQDNGSGIDPNQLPHIFDRFYRPDQSRNRQTGNAGLGLAIVKTIVEAHGGTVEVASGTGQGTCFTIYLPLIAEITLPAKPRPTGILSLESKAIEN
jgi:two-component system OmpR family sensor kinase